MTTSTSWRNDKRTPRKYKQETSTGYWYRDRNGRQRWVECRVTKYYAAPDAIVRMAKLLDAKGKHLNDIARRIGRCTTTIKHYLMIKDKEINATCAPNHSTDWLQNRLYSMVQR